MLEVGRSERGRGRKGAVDGVLELAFDQREIILSPFTESSPCHGVSSGAASVEAKAAAYHVLPSCTLPPDVIARDRCHLSATRL